LLIVEDDESFLQRLARAMQTRGFEVTTAETLADGLLQVEAAPRAFAVLTCASATATDSMSFPHSNTRFANERQPRRGAFAAG
jgi:ActR/RegA family two-component response regulator